MGDPSQSVLFNTDWTVSTIVQQIERSNIDLDPAFQRRSAWDPHRRSRLVTDLPIPNVVLAEAKGSRGKFIVIDGKQRLSTFYDFISAKSDDRLVLRGLSLREDLNGMTYESMKAEKPDDANFLDNAPVRRSSSGTGRLNTRPAQ
jgi:hypothetical protein